MLCVPNSPEVVEVVDAMLPALGAGKTVVDCSTIDPEVERDRHARVAGTGARYLDAPLSGGTAGAQKGTLTLMVGGDAATLAAIEPALEPFAGLIVHVGGPGMGQVVKLCNKVIYAAQMTATAEATAMAVKSGVDMDKLLQVLTHATGDCVAVRTRLPVPGVMPESPASNGWQPGFMTDLMAKDLDLALAYAAAPRRPHGHHGGGRQLLTATSSAGYGREDFSAVAKVVLALSGARDEPGAAAHAGARPGRRPPRPRRDDDRELGRVLRPRWPRPSPRATGSWPRRSRWEGWPGRATSPRRTGPTSPLTGPAWPARPSSWTTGSWPACRGRRRTDGRG